MITTCEKNGCDKQLDDARDKTCNGKAKADLYGLHVLISRDLVKYSVTYRECETTRFDWRETEKDKKYVEGCICKTEAGSRQTKGTDNRHGYKHPESVWFRFLFPMILGDRLAKSSTFARQSLRWQVNTEVGNCERKLTSSRTR